MECLIYKGLNCTTANCDCSSCVILWNNSNLKRFKIDELKKLLETNTYEGKTVEPSPLFRRLVNNRIIKRTPVKEF